MKTSDRLAKELMIQHEREAEIGNHYKAANYKSFACRARTGEFDDYSDKHVCGPTQIYVELIAKGLYKFAQRVASGEFDATTEESDEWARSPEGQEAAKQLSPEMRKLLNMNIIN